MGTEKLNDGELIEVNPLPVELKPVVLEEKNNDRKARFIISSLALVVLLLSVCRVPYCGSYLDSIFFDYLFGQIKYVIYGYLFVVCILFMTNVKFRKILVSKRFIVGFTILILGLCVGESAVLMLISLGEGKKVDFVQMMTSYNSGWLDYSLLNQTYNNFITVPLSGGLIGEFVVSISLYVNYVLVILLAVILIVVGVLFVSNNTNAKLVVKARTVLIHWLGGDINSRINELQPQKTDIKPQLIQRQEIEMEAGKNDQITPPISFLTDTSLDNYFINKENAEEVEKDLSKYFKKNGINAIYKKTVIMPIFYEIYYEFENEAQIQDILKQQKEISNYIKIGSYNINFKKNILRFEIRCNKFSKISLKNIISAIPQNQPYTAAIGINYENEPIFMDLEKFPNSLLIGKRGSGAIMLQTVLIASLAYTNSANCLNMVMISTEQDKNLDRFNDLPHLLTNVIKDNMEALKCLIDTKTKILERNRKILDFGVKSFSQYNEKVDANLKLPAILLFISGFDSLIKNNIQAAELINDLAALGESNGLFMILTSSSVNNETLNSLIYEKLDAKLILKVETEYESMRLFDSYRAWQLYGSGDGIFVNSLNKTNIRFQSCYLNQIELNQIIDIIKTFNESKNK